MPITTSLFVLTQALAQEKLKHELLASAHEGNEAHSTPGANLFCDSARVRVGRLDREPRRHRSVPSRCIFGRIRRARKKLGSSSPDWALGTQAQKLNRFAANNVRLVLSHSERIQIDFDQAAHLSRTLDKRNLRRAPARAVEFLLFRTGAEIEQARTCDARRKNIEKRPA